MARSITEGVKDTLDVVYLTVDDVPTQTAPFKSVVVHKRPEGLAARFLRRVLEEHKITHVLISQPLLWYSEVAATVCREFGVEQVTWFEDFLGGAHIYDKLGGPYTAHNEIQKFSEQMPVQEPLIPAATRFQQPVVKTPDEIVKTYGTDPEKTVVVFGQTEWDMSLAEHEGRLPYEDWIRTLIRSNPGMTFLFKDHPSYKTRGVSELARELVLGRNVQLYTESIWPTFQTFRHFASYSSTVILEGAFAGKRFITGGRHFLDDPELSLVATGADQLAGACARAREFKVNELKLRSYLSFITRFYTMVPTDSRLTARLTTSSEEFFGRLAKESGR